MKNLGRVAREVRVALGVGKGEAMTDAQEESRSDLELLAKLIKERNANEVGITNIIKRPAQIGHLGGQGSGWRRRQDQKTLGKVDKKVGI